MIETEFSVGGRSWPIEVTLTNRLGMAMHMLVGRQALLPEITIDATERFCQPELNYDLYHSTRAMRESAVRRALRIAVLTRENNYSNDRLIAEGEARGQRLRKLIPAAVIWRSMLCHPKYIMMAPACPVVTR